MRIRINLIIFLLLLVSNLFPVETITLKKEDNLSEQLVKNEIFVQHIFGFDFEDEDLYIVDSKYGTILKVNMKTGKLIKTISSKGQGPGELEMPVQIIVKNNKLYVLDAGWRGIKVFDKDGKYISSFHVSLPFFFFFGRISESFAVNEKEQVFVANPDMKEHTLVTVYDGKNGKKICSLINENLTKIKDRKRAFEEINYGVRLDKEDNIYLLYPLRRRIKKFTPSGKLLWDKLIENEFIKKEIKKRGKEEVVIIKGRNIKVKDPLIHGFEVTENGTVFISQWGGCGCILDKDGKLLALIKGINSITRIKKDRIVGCAGIVESFYVKRIPVQLQRIL